MYYIFIQEDKINGAGQAKILNEDYINFEVEEELYNSFVEAPDKYIWDGENVVENPDYEEIVKQKERQRLDALTLTPSDVERALYKAKGMDFEDLKALISQALPQVDLKGLAIEFRAKDFWRGATLEDGTRIFDVVGALLGYTPEDMDYLFENKELPLPESDTEESEE